MPGEAQLLQGTLDLLILKAVSLGRLHGYGSFGVRLGRVSPSPAPPLGFSRHP